MIEPMPEPQRDKQLFGARFCLAMRATGDKLGQDDILARIEIGEQVMELIDEAEMIAAQHGARARVRFFRRMTPNNDLAAEAPLEQADRLEQRRLARSRRPKQRDDLARADREVDPAQHVDPLAALLEAAGKLLELDHRFHAHITHNAAPARDRCSPPSTRGRA